MNNKTNPKTVIVIAGPTAVGKTAVAIDVARKFGTEIISADSRQCYREMNIGVARPSPRELAAVPHHFIATHSIHDKITAAYFEDYALKKAEEIFSKKDVLVIVGGTGLYISAFLHGLDAIPEVPEEVRVMVRNEYDQKGLEWLQEEIKKSDPLFYAQGETQNPQRLMRALEVVRASGKSILDFRGAGRKERPFKTNKVLVDLPRETLYERINQRVDMMMESGLLEEVRSLLPYQHLNALQTVGYQELFDHLNGQTTLDFAVEDIKKHTRNYAKRQMTWFRKDVEFVAMKPEDVLTSVSI